MQKRKHSAAESVINTIFGFMISFMIQIVIYPALDIEVQFHENVIITCIFTIASIIRGYVLRRIFNRIK